MRFMCDAMLGKLARYLRALGLDAVYVRSASDMARYGMNGEASYFLTKRKFLGLSQGNLVYIKADNVIDQLKQIRTLILPYTSEKALMSRCTRCNTLLMDVGKDEVEGLIPEFVFHRYDSFKTCPSCKKIYWEGSHVEHMTEWIRELKEPTES